MNRRFFVLCISLLFVSGGVCLAGCGSDAISTPDTPVVTPPEEGITNLVAPTTAIPGSGGAVTITFKAAAAWTAMPGQTWCKPDKTKGEAGNISLTVSADANNDTKNDRNASIRITCGKQTETITVTQKKGEPKMESVPFAAFPGAEGHGRNTVGGRGGKVYHVTNLNDSGEGSLRWALGKNGPKTIVFDVAGTIHLKSRLATGKDYLTIAGQTSPGGICLADYPFVINSNEVIIRFMRFRPGDATECDGLGGFDKKNIIVDHCSVSWSVDECLSVYGMKNSTVQWCIASQALHNSIHTKGSHGYGGIWGGDHASFHHNLIAHCSSRTPRFGPRPGTQENEWVDARNNVYYNWAGVGCYGAEGMNINIVNNYYKPGPATPNKKQRYRIVQIGIRTEEYCKNNPSYAPMKHKWGTFYIDGNKVEGNAEVTADNWTKGVYEQIENKNVDNLWNDQVKAAITKTSPVMDHAGVTTHTADEAYKLVLARVGASNYRDILDEVIINDVKNGTATCDAPSNSEGKGFINSQKDVLAGIPELGDNPYPVLKTDASRSITDTDGDGMPDDFEVQYKLNPNDAVDGNAKTLDPAGNYTNLEMYLHELVKDIMILE